MRGTREQVLVVPFVEEGLIELLVILRSLTSCCDGHHCKVGVQLVDQVIMTATVVSTSFNEWDLNSRSVEKPNSWLLISSRYEFMRCNLIARTSVEI